MIRTRGKLAPEAPPLSLPVTVNIFPCYSKPVPDTGGAAETGLRKITCLHAIRGDNAYRYGQRLVYVLIEGHFDKLAGVTGRDCHNAPQTRLGLLSPTVRVTCKAYRSRPVINVI